MFHVSLDLLTLFQFKANAHKGREGDLQEKRPLAGKKELPSLNAGVLKLTWTL